MSDTVVPAGRPGDIVAVTVSVALASGASVPTGQTSGDPLQPVDARPLSPPPDVSVTVTPVAVDGPLLVTVIV